MIRRNFLKSVLALAAAPVLALVPKKPERVIGVDISNGPDQNVYSFAEAQRTGRGYYYITEEDLMKEDHFPFAERI